jgi:putative nucleotidyltransferase with HDIG domain
MFRRPVKFTDVCVIGVGVSGLSLRFKGVLATATLVSAILVAIVALLGRQIEPRLEEVLLAGLCATLLASLATWLAVERISVPLRRLAEAMSAMARTGDLGRSESTFRSSGSGNRDVRLIEETFRALLVSLEESQRARERSYVEAVGAVVTAADARDHETTGHSFRVALYAMTLARALGLPAEQLKAIEWGALLHDVGKMAVPDGVLRKPGPLTDNEWHIMKQHPTWGFDMLAEVSFLQPAAIDIVYSHHERWDGHGYPRGLGGDQIPLAARVFAVVDTYDAITSDRPYRRARGHAAAVAEMRRVSGQQLDPAMVEAFAGLSELELRQLTDRCRNVHPGLSLPDDLLDSLTDPGAEALRG